MNKPYTISVWNINGFHRSFFLVDTDLSFKTRFEKLEFLMKLEKEEDCFSWLTSARTVCFYEGDEEIGEIRFTF